MAAETIMPPEGTSIGCRHEDGSMWVAAMSGEQPAIAVCLHPGNWLNPACYELVGVFKTPADRDFVLSLHHQFLTKEQ